MAEDTTTTTTDDMVSDVPPPAVPSGSSNVLQPGVRLRPRKVTTVAPSMPAPTLEEQTPQGYIGQGLVDNNGVLARGQYSEDEALSEIAKFGTPAERAAVLNRLAVLGLYGKSRPSLTGVSSRDISAVKQALLYANTEGVTLDRALNLMAADPNIKAKASGGRVRTTAKQDLRAVFKQATQSVLGRDLSDAEVERFIRSYNAMEVSEAMGGAVAPSAQTAALESAQAAAPDEAGAMQLLGYANVIDQLMKGLG